MKAIRVALIPLVCLAPLAASAEWQWLDASGHRVFSDHPPPQDIAPNRILKQPGMRTAAPAPEAAPAGVSTAVAPAAAPKPAGRDKALEERRRQMEAAEAEKKKAEEAKVAAARAENCTRARSARANLTSGQRIFLVNDQGEREFMDEDRRGAELRRVDAVIAQDCGAGVPQ